MFTLCETYTFSGQRAWVHGKHVFPMLSMVPALIREQSVSLNYEAQPYFVPDSCMKQILVPCLEFMSEPHFDLY